MAEEFEGGRGGKARLKKIDDTVSDMETGRGSRSTSSSGSYVAPKKKAPYVPSEKEKRSRSYGAPISPPLVRQRDGQSTDSNNKY